MVSYIYRWYYSIPPEPTEQELKDRSIYREIRHKYQLHSSVRRLTYLNDEDFEHWMNVIHDIESPDQEIIRRLRRQAIAERDDNFILKTAKWVASWLPWS